MKTRLNPLAIVLLAVLGCGQQLVEFGPDAGGPGGGPGGPPDSSAPTVTATDPLDLAVNVLLTQKVNATFSKAMDPATISSTTFTLTQGTPATAVPGAVSYSAVNTVATFTPTSPLASNTKYTATVTTGAKSVAGTALASNYVWTFTTAAGPPQVISTNPLDGSSNLCVPLLVSATFDKFMDPLTITSANFTLAAGAGNTPVNGSVSYNAQSKTATFAPANPLLAGTSYTAKVSTGVKDTVGNSLAADKIFAFSTASSSTGCKPTPINLRGIASYGIASNAGLTSTGITVVNGDVALYPTATCSDATGNAGAGQSCLVKIYKSPTGLTVNGSIYYAGDPFDNGGTAKSVTTDLNIAWVEGKNKVNTQPAVAGDEIGGKTFVPGVYQNAALGMAQGTFATLDAGNDQNAVFIFKVDSSFVDSGTLLQPTEIKLINGAQARNVFFVAGLDVTLGQGTKWNGTILAGRTATINRDTTVIGRVLAGATGTAGAITLTGAASPSLTSITLPQ